MAGVQKWGSPVGPGGPGAGAALESLEQEELERGAQHEVQTQNPSSLVFE